MRVYDDFYGLNGAIAWVNCPPGATTSGSHPLVQCFNQTLKYNLSYGLSVEYSTTASRKFVACHELGHTVALRHSNDDNHPDPDATCMRAPIGAAPYPQSINSNHDAGIINFWY